LQESVDGLEKNPLGKQDKKKSINWLDFLVQHAVALSWLTEKGADLKLTRVRATRGECAT
jgi:hypothetical protein